MKHLNLSSDLSFPPDLVTNKTVVYGLNGMGKSNLTLGKLPEELNRLGLRFCILDLMGVAWGLQHGSLKGQKGIDVLILGGPHGDIEIEPTAGAVVADLVADEHVSTIIDMSRQKSGKGWSKAEKIRFHADFYLRLYERQAETRRPLLIIQDEAARVIPQTIPYGSPDLARCVGAIETLAEEGRALGVGMVFVTPRSARLNKSVAELAETMIAFRTVGPNSVGAVIDWLGQHVEKARHKEIVEKLRSLPVGSALVVSPGWLGHEGIVRFHMRSTFDSTATPKPGVEVRAPGDATKPDLAKYRARMQATIAKAQENDPAALKREIAALKLKLNALPQVVKSAAPLIERVEVSVLKDAHVKRIEVAVCRAEGLNAKILPALAEVARLVAAAVAIHPKHLNIGEPATTPKKPGTPFRPGLLIKQPGIAEKKTAPDTPTGELKGGLTPMRRRILGALGFLEGCGLTPADRRQVAFFADASPNGGSYNDQVGALRSAGLIEYPPARAGYVGLTPTGRALAEPQAVPQTAADLHATILAKLPPMRARILRAAIAVYPADMSREEVAASAVASAAGGSFNDQLGALRSLGVIEYPSQGRVRAADILFLKEA